MINYCLILPTTMHTSIPGIVTPIMTELRVEGAGLGAAGSRIVHGANATRRERARTSMMSRYQELN